MIAAWLLALLFLLPLSIHIYAEVFRWRAEHLLTQLKALRVEEAPATTVLRLRSEYASSRSRPLYRRSLLVLDRTNRVEITHSVFVKTSLELPNEGLSCRRAEILRVATQ
jgi:hypothetical protein